MVIRPGTRGDKGSGQRRRILQRPWFRSLAAATVVAVPLLVLYLQTLMPDVGFWDTAEFQAVGPLLGTAHPTGFPVYTLLAWLASVTLQPLGNEAFRVNVLSAVLVAGGVGIVAVTVTLLSGRVVVGIAAGLSLGLAAQTWSVGLHADPHALHVLLVALLLLLLVQWGERTRTGGPADRWLVWAAVVFGVSLANHGQTVLLAPGIAVYLLAVDSSLLRRPRFVLGCALAMLLTTAALYLYLPIRSAMNPPLDYANPQTWGGFWYVVLAEQFRGSFRALPDVTDAIALVVGESWRQLGLIGLLALIGVATSFRRRPGLLLLLVTWFGLNWLFALAYDNADIGRYYIVPMLTVAVLGGIGAGAVIDTIERSVVGRARRPDGAATASRRLVAGAMAFVLIGSVLAAIPGRYPLVDQSADRSARQWLTAMMAALPPDAVLVSWWSYSTTFWYGQYIEGLRPDVTLIDDSTIVELGMGDATAAVDAYLDQRPVFLIRLPEDIPEFADRYVVTLVEQVPAGPLYHVHGLRARASSRPHL